MCRCRSYSQPEVRLVEYFQWDAVMGQRSSPSPPLRSENNALFSFQVELRFPAPSKTGNYQYSVILRSDSYLGLDQIKPLKVTPSPRVHPHLVILHVTEFVCV